MGNTFSQIYIQTVFAVKYRESLIAPSWEEELYKYTTGIFNNTEQKLLAINWMPDHIHILFRMEPTCRISDLMREVKKSTNNFINDNHLSRKRFQWQGGYGAFSYGKSQIDQVCKYVINQKQHHTKQSFKTEYTNLLTLFEIAFKNEYLFEFYD